MRYNVSEEVVKLEDKITEALNIAKNNGLKAVIDFFGKRK